MGQKRNRRYDGPYPPKKRVCLPAKLNCKSRLRADTAPLPPLTPIHHPVLSLYFGTLLTLREYLLRTLNFPGEQGAAGISSIDLKSDAELSSLLDSTLVGITKQPQRNLTQDIADCSGTTSESRSPGSSQSEIVDLTLHILFLRSISTTKVFNTVYRGKPNNILTSGYTLNSNSFATTTGFNAGPLGIDIVNHFPNTHVNTLKSPLWGRLLEVIGEDAMLNLLLNTSIFVALEKVKGNYYQLVGPPISDALNNPAYSEEREMRNSGEIAFARSRMFYSQPANNERGQVLFGLRPIHILNRFPNRNQEEHTVHILKYIFPRQFGLHNVFTSEVDKSETVHPLKDYTLRDQEITALETKENGKDRRNVPKRLNGKVLELVSRMQRLHRRCSYHALIKYYCPVALCDPGVTPELSSTASSNKDSLTTETPSHSPTNITLSNSAGSSSELSGGIKSRKETFIDHSSTTGEVAGFAKAVIRNVIPYELFGDDQNRKAIMRNVERFVKLRRYESLSLHEVMQGLKLTQFAWLAPDNLNRNQKLSLSDARKRSQLLAEFVYWLIDSFLIPLLSAHFYITETNVHRNRVFYFRHDVWKKLSEPTLKMLKIDMFEQLPTETAKRILDRRELGFSQIRLLPKEQGIRPIMNLKKKGMVTDKVKGKNILTPSINTIMTPVYNVLSYEKTQNPSLLGSSMFSVGDMHLKLKSFQAFLKSKNWSHRKLYFTKVDIHSCFNTIPQLKLLSLIDHILSEDEYRFDKFAEVQAPVGSKSAGSKPVKKFVTKAKPVDDFERFEEWAKKELVVGKKETVFVDGVVRQFKEKEVLMDLLEGHIRENIIEIGKQFFRQKSGIPQGSILSTMLCSFFYADLEKTKLPFIADEDGILLRLIDDFLFITLNRANAKQFLKVMHAGHPEYGASVSVDKTLVNFETSIDGRKVDRLVGTEFPYCGTLINTKNLNVRKDREKRGETNINDTLTVEYSKSPGLALHRKAISSFKFQAQAMFFDSNLNKPATVSKNIYHSFLEAAMKFHRTVKALRGKKRPRERFLTRVIQDILTLAFVMLKSGQKGKAGVCKVTKEEVVWLGALAFKRILQRKQTAYRKVLKSLDGIINSKGRWRKVGRLGVDAFGKFRY